MKRREFLELVGEGAAGSLACLLVTPGLLDKVEAAVAQADDAPASEVARDEKIWEPVRRGYKQTSRFINLESGYFSPGAEAVLEARLLNIREINAAPSFYMRRLRVDDREAVREKLARLAGCPPEEIAITRNTTESLNIVIHGMDLSAGDEVLYCEREYPSMKEALQQRSARFGIRLRKIQVPMVPKDPSEVARIYEKAITSRTRAILVSHMIYVTGQVLPVREIAEMAHRRGLQVIIDGAHSFAHLDYRIPDLGGDYFGASLHKWLGAPLGLGVLWMRKDRIAKTWPLFGDTGQPKDDIRKFEHIGTHPCSAVRTLADAIRFHETIGAKRKEARLRYLKEYWVERVASLPRVSIKTPRDPRQSCAITNVAIGGMTPAEVADALFDRYGIFTVAVDTGVRVAPNLFSSLQDLDALVRAIRELAA